MASTQTPEPAPQIHVTKTFLPARAEFQRYLDGIWARGRVTNDGPLVRELEARVCAYLGVARLQYVSSGTVALQLALDALGIDGGEVITTPFSYVATLSAILWQRCTPVFVDIDPATLCLDPARIEPAITEQTRAILPVHVFGRPCDVDAIGALAARYGLPVIYDGAHAFGVRYRGRSLLSFGDVATCSFHATKVFHTGEGGAVIAADEAVDGKVEVTKRFGHDADDHVCVGINAKPSEIHAALGLCNLGSVDDRIRARRVRSEVYDDIIDVSMRPTAIGTDTSSNYSYYPVLLRDEMRRSATTQALVRQGIHPRAYFSPALHQLPYLDGPTASCPEAERISTRVLCLPLYEDLDLVDVQRIGRIETEINR